MIPSSPSRRVASSVRNDVALNLVDIPTSSIAELPTSEIAVPVGIALFLAFLTMSKDSRFPVQINVVVGDNGNDKEETVVENEDSSSDTPDETEETTEETPEESSDDANEEEEEAVEEEEKSTSDKILSVGKALLFPWLGLLIGKFK